MSDASPGPTVTIIVVSYNTREMTLACLRSVFEQTTRMPFELIVVDNQSEDGSADAIEAEFGGRVRLIRAGTNLGFAAANNLAAEDARGEYLLLLNPDTVVLDRGIERLLAFAQDNPAAGIYGGRTLTPEKELDPTSCWRRPTLWSAVCRATGLAAAFPRSSLLNSEAYGGWNRTGVRSVDIITGCFLLIDAALWNTLEGFDERFFMYGEEADLCLRARRFGASPQFTDAAAIIHYAGASSQLHEHKLLRQLRAHALLMRLHWPASHYLIGIVLLHVWLLRHLAQASLRLVASPTAGRSDFRIYERVLRRPTRWLPPRNHEVTT